MEPHRCSVGPPSWAPRCLPSPTTPLPSMPFLVARRMPIRQRFRDLRSRSSNCSAPVYARRRFGQNDPMASVSRWTDYTHSTAPNRRIPRPRHAAAASRPHSPASPSPYTDTAGEHCRTLHDGRSRNEAKVEKTRGQVRCGIFALVEGRASGSGCHGDRCIGQGDVGSVRVLMAEGKVVRGAAGLDVGERVRVRNAGPRRYRSRLH